MPILLYWYNRDIVIVKWYYCW